MTWQSLPSPGSTRSRSPGSTVLWIAPMSCVPHATLGCLRVAIPCVASVLSLPSAQIARPRARGSSSGPHSRTLSHGDDQDLPGSWRTLLSLCPVLRPRQDRRIRPLQCAGTAPAMSTTKAPTTIHLSGLNRTALGLAVYASSRASPPPTQNSLPAAGQLCRTGLVTRRAPVKGFRNASYISSSFPKLGLAQGHRDLFCTTT
jgi:hypothetical protein